MRMKHPDRQKRIPGRIRRQRKPIRPDPKRNP